MTETVKPLKKLRLQVIANNTPGTVPAGAPVTVEFIFGIGSAGLSPFESVLSGKKKGDIVSLAVTSNGAQGYFGHCLGNFHQLFGSTIMAPTMYLTVTVDDIVDADNREVVRSLAQSLAHGCGGDSCGCGCS